LRYKVMTNTDTISYSLQKAFSQVTRGTNPCETQWMKR
jgi:hypothetical protein